MSASHTELKNFINIFVYIYMCVCISFRMGVTGFKNVETDKRLAKNSQLENSSSKQIHW